MDPRHMRARTTMPAASGARPDIPPTSQGLRPPRMAPPVDLMSLVGGVYDPHEGEPDGSAIKSEITDEYESVAKFIPLFPLGTSVTAPVYTMSKRWEGIDISINVPPSINMGAIAGNAIGVQLFALAGGVRALVASGRFGIDDFNAGSFNPGVFQKRLIAFRGAAEKFDVQISANFLANGPDVVQVVMHAANDLEAFDDDQNIGVMSLSANDLLLSGSSGFSVSADVPLELVGLVGVNVNASTRYLHVHDKPAGTNVTGLAPIHSYALGPGAGPSAGFETFERILRVRRFVRGILLACSTTPFTTTAGAAGDMGFQAWYR